LKKGDIGIRKIATTLGVGTGTVQRIKAEMSACPLTAALEDSRVNRLPQSVACGLRTRRGGDLLSLGPTGWGHHVEIILGWAKGVAAREKLDRHRVHRETVYH
jgi:hypothetical protein